ncbi:MAG: hypothetical protein LBG80_12310 [Bacteroidales bacterium]|jgi:hypothetical protein|nr:hypothetical protein [Bacteroidales bacterium]
MLAHFASIINSPQVNVNVVGDSVFINNYTINSLVCLNSLDTQQCINSFHKNGNIVTFYDLAIGDTINIELSLLRLTTIGYYETLDSFITKNTYSVPTQSFYIRDINCFSSDNNNIIDSYRSVISLIVAIKRNARYCHSEADIDISLIFKEDKALLLPFVYDATDIQQISQDNIDNINGIVTIFCSGDSKEKLIFINELIDFLIAENENSRFKFLLSHIAEFSDRANNAYQYYIRDFSYNRLKTELDNATLEYSKKIQSVINDAQTKLIAIPMAFVLATASMDFDKILSSKNIGIVVSLFVFAWLIELFIRNQKSALVFIKQNIDVYKQTFKSIDDIVENSFKTVDAEWKKQNRRIITINWIIWSIPIIILIISIIFLFIQNP